MFHAPIGRFQLELIIILPIFPPLSHPTFVCFFPVGLSSLIRHFQRVLWVLKFLGTSQETEETSTPTRPVQNVTLMTKGLQERNTQRWMGRHTYIDTFKYHVFAPMGRFQLELIYLCFPPSFHLIYVCFCPVGLSLL